MDIKLLAAKPQSLRGGLLGVVEDIYLSLRPLIAEAPDGACSESTHSHIPGPETRTNQADTFYRSIMQHRITHSFRSLPREVATFAVPCFASVQQQSLTRGNLQAEQRLR